MTNISAEQHSRGREARGATAGVKRSACVVHHVETAAELAHERVRLLERREVAPGCELIPIDELAEALFCPTSRRAEDLFGEDADAGREGDGIAVDLVEALPIEPRLRGPGIGQPVEHDVVDELVACQHVFGMTVAVRPRPEFLDDPRQLTRR